MIEKKGFTLIELLLVMTIFAVLTGVTLVAINPSKNIAEANNVSRRNDIKAILDAIGQYAVENRGRYPMEMEYAYGYIGNDSTNGQVDICNYLVPDFLAEMPMDPTYGGEDYYSYPPRILDPFYNDCTDYNTGYRIERDYFSGRFVISAPGAENGETISITR